MSDAQDPLYVQREAVAAAMRRIYALRLTTTTGGNVSLRQPGGGCLITPSGGDKSATMAEEIVAVDADGKTLAGSSALRPSTEFPMHLAIYRRCPRVQGIVHAHPPTATAFAACGEPILADLTSEAFAILRRVVLVSYAVPSSDRLGELVAEAARRADCLVMEQHGAVTLGATLDDATNRLEVLEAAAWQTWLLKTMGHVRRLSPDQLRDLEAHYGPWAGDEE